MATVIVKVRALTGTILEYDMVAIENRGRIERYPFKFSPLGTADASVHETEIEASKQADFEAAVIAKVGVTIVQNPEWNDVKTDDGGLGTLPGGDTTEGDGINDGTRYNWAQYTNLYEIVV